MSAKKILLILIVNLVLSLLQTAFFPEFFGNYIYLNLVLSLGFALLLVDKTNEAFLSVCIGGLITDLLGVGIIGLGMFVMIFVTSASFYVYKFFFRSRSVRILLIFFSNIVFNFIALEPRFVLNTSLIGSGFLNLILVFIIYFVLQGFQVKSNRYKV
jgi:hypothetical protein